VSRRCDYCGAVSTAGRDKCPNCGAAYLCEPTQAPAGPISTYLDFLAATGPVQFSDTYNELVRRSRSLAGIVFPVGESA